MLICWLPRMPSALPIACRSGVGAGAVGVCSCSARPHLKVLTRLGAPKHAHVVSALGPNNVVRPTRDWTEFDSTLSREHVDAAVIDPMADSLASGGRVTDYQSPQRRRGNAGAYIVPSVPFVLYLDVSAPAMRLLVELVRLGAFSLVIRG